MPKDGGNCLGSRPPSAGGGGLGIYIKKALLREHLTGGGRVFRVRTFTTRLSDRRGIAGILRQSKYSSPGGGDYFGGRAVGATGGRTRRI